MVRLGGYFSEYAAAHAAYRKLKRLEELQPSSDSGGQGPGGIQDRVYIKSPSGEIRRVMPPSEEAQQGKTHAFFFSGKNDEPSRQMEEYAKANQGSLLAGAIEDVKYLKNGLHELVTISLLTPGTNKVTVLNFKVIFNNRKEPWTLDEDAVRHILIEYGFTVSPHNPDIYELRGPLQSKSLYSILRNTRFDPAGMRQNSSED